MKVIGFHYIGDRSHEVLKNWMLNVGCKIYPFFPEKYSFLKGKGWLNQPLGFLKGLFIVPRADIYIHTGMASLIITAFKPGKNIVMNADQFFRFFDQYSWIKKKYLKFLLKRVDGFISLDFHMKKLAEKYTPSTPNEVAYPYCDLERFVHIKPNLKSDTICYIGLSYFPKEVDVLLKAFDLIKKDYPKAKLIICGDGPLRTKIKDPAITWYKYHPSIEEVLAKCGCYINAVRHDAFGVSVQEAMASGIAPIISEFTGTQEILPKSAKWLIVPLDAEEIARRYRILKESGLRKKIGKDCRIEAKKYTKERSVKMFKEAFNKLVG